MSKINPNDLTIPLEKLEFLMTDLQTVGVYNGLKTGRGRKNPFQLINMEWKVLRNSLLSLEFN
jgi:hypothetical protein